MAFKRTADGYVFRAPSRWLIGPARHYLVDETRKDAIVCALADIRVQGARALILLVAIILVGLVISIYFRPHLLLAGASAVALLVAFVALVRFHQLAALQPLLASLPRTAERITWRDRLAAASAVTSMTHLVMLGLCFSAISLTNGLELIEAVAQADDDARWLRLIARGTLVISFSGIAVMNFVVAYIKLKNRRR